MNDKSRLLIVDDDEHGRETLEMLLAPEGYQLEFATDGEKALKQAIELIPDLILLDVMMPGMDGFEVCERLRTHATLEAVPVIMLTALDDRDSKLRALQVGVDDFISKPFDRVELRARVRTITRLNRYRRLLAERSSFEWVVEQSNDGYLLLSDGDIIRYANSAARFYLGLLSDTTLSEGFLKRVEVQHYQREPETAWQDWPANNAGLSPRYLVRTETADSASLWLQVDTFELPADDASNQLVHLSDVSQQMNLQQQMWTFQSLVSHKLRAPLNGLVSLQILDHKKMDLTSERAHTLLRIAKESAKRLQDQILDILRYIDSSQLLKTNQIFHLKILPHLIHRIEVDLEIPTAQVNVATSLEEKSLAFSNQGIELILRELFTNAKKFHPQHMPTIDIQLTAVDDHTIILRFTDDGRHLSKEDIAKAGIPYYQIEKYFTGEVKGMGLGLAMIAKLVWSMGGRYHLNNRPDQPGITTTLTLPLVNP